MANRSIGQRDFVLHFKLPVNFFFGVVPLVTAVAVAMVIVFFGSDFNYGTTQRVRILLYGQPVRTSNGNLNIIKA